MGILRVRWVDSRMGEELPRGYATAWYDWERYERVLYPVPLHILANLWHRLYARMLCCYRLSVLDEAYEKGRRDARAELVPHLKTPNEEAILSRVEKAKAKWEDKWGKT